MKKYLALLSIAILTITYWVIHENVNTALLSAISSVCFIISLSLSIYTYKELPILSLIVTSLIYALASSNEVFDFYLSGKIIGYSSISKFLWDLGNLIRLFMFVEILLILKKYKLIKR